LLPLNCISNMACMRKILVIFDKDLVISLLAKKARKWVMIETYLIQA